MYTVDISSLCIMKYATLLLFMFGEGDIGKFYAVMYCCRSSSNDYPGFCFDFKSVIFPLYILRRWNIVMKAAL